MKKFHQNEKKSQIKALPIINLGIKKLQIRKKGDNNKDDLLNEKKVRTLNVVKFTKERR